MLPAPLALILLSAAAAPPQAPAPSPSSPSPLEVKIERLQWTKEVDGAPPVTAIEIRNDFGDIRARRAGDRRLDVSMVVQRLDRAGDRVGFTVERRGGVLALVVAYPPGRVRDSDPAPPKDSYDRVDLVVFVPEGVTLRASTLRGQVEAVRLRSDVEAATLDGAINVRTTGTVQARTAGGEVNVYLEALEAGRPLILQSASGPISVTLPTDGPSEVRVATGGEIVSGLRLQKRRRGLRTEAALPPAGNAPLVLVDSTSGRVSVERAIPALLP
ncbi:MAG TPA: hypothetical protein VFO85_12360 [Vicinamibacteria bacterium]|nr:hypothetical protein [Vicinamibacteria bacterium]